MAVDGDKDIEQSEKLGKLQSEVHTLSNAVNKLFEKFDTFIDRNQPKTLSLGGMLGIATSILGIIVIFFGSILWIITSALAPINTTLTQLAQISQDRQKEIQQNTSYIQLTNKELSGIKSIASSNGDTLQWLLYDENIPKQLTQLIGRVDALESKEHLHPSMSIVIPNSK